MKGTLSECAADTVSLHTAANAEVFTEFRFKGPYEMKESSVDNLTGPAIFSDDVKGAQKMLHERSPEVSRGQKRRIKAGADREPSVQSIRE